jgi:hypothetical protein
MATMTDTEHIQYFRSRWPYTRPNLITLANNSGKYYSLDTNKVWLPAGIEGVDYIFLSDHNRSSANFSIERIGDRRRMINASMRSYFIADKITLPLTWEALPSRAYSDHRGYAWWVQNKDRCAKFTADGGAGGADLLNWWKRHSGSMWAFMNVDENVDHELPESQFINGYSRVYEVMIVDFSYEVTNRSHGFILGTDMYSFDLWNVTITLEEV